ncbi:hypothetical protein Tco_1157287 [Tanacetum coccineum]
MATLKFADTHNMVAFLSKPAESDGFEQIVDFLNAQPIRYALNNYGLLAWSKLSIGKYSYMLYPKTIAWNEFSSTMASAIICLATNQKFNFSKFIFEDEAVYKELGDSLVRAATTASSLEAEHDSGNINKTQYKATPNESSSLGITSGGGPRCQETMGDTIAQTRFENVSKLSNDLLLARGNTLQSDEDRLKLDELMAFCTTLQSRVLDLEKTKTPQANEIATRVESSGDEEDLCEDASKQGRRINAIDADEDITLVNVQDDADNEMFNVDALNGEEVFVVGQNENVVEKVVDVAQVSTAATTITITTKEITLAQALEALKTLKPMVKGIVFQEPEKPVKPIKKKDQISFDEEVALKLQAEFDEEERLIREKVKKEKVANISLIEEWDDIQAKIDVDYQLAKRLQAQEQEELSIE